MRYVFSTEKVNSYGFWVLTSGIRLERYKKNPVLLYEHKSKMLPVGRVDDIRVEGGELTGEVVFDEEDDLGLKLKKKYEGGFMRGFSIGFDVLSTDTSNLKDGQTRASVSESELLEISCASIPSNEDAVVQLYKGGKAVCLSSGDDIGGVVPNVKKRNMKRVLLFLGMDEAGSEDALIGKIKAERAELSAAQEKAVKLQAELDAIKKLQADNRKQEFTRRLDNPRLALNAEQRKAYLELYDTAPDHADKMLSAQKEVVKLNNVPNGDGDGGGDSDLNKLSFSELQKNHPEHLAYLKRSEPSAR